MNKLTLCRLTTLLSNPLPSIYTQLGTGTRHDNHWKEAALVLLSASSSTQWIDYRKRKDAALTKTNRLGWLRLLLFSMMIGLTILTASAQSTWTAVPRSSHALVDVAYGAGRYVAVGDYGLIQLSTDGTLWTNLSSSQLQTDGLAAIVYANNTFVTVGNNGRILTSPNGLTWTSQTSNSGEALTGITYGGGMFIAVGWNGTIITSTDAKTWVKQISGTQYVLTGITYGGNQFVVVGQYGLIKTSPNGITWTERPLPVSGVDLRGVTVGPNGSFVAVGDLTVIVTSPDGLNWTYRPVIGLTTYLTSVAYNSAQGRYVAVSSQCNQLVSSTDGVTWKAASTGTPILLYGVRYLQGRFLATGEGASLHASFDGSTFKPLTINQAVTLYGAAFGNGRYVAVGTYSRDNNQFMASLAVTSTDGVNYAVGEPVHFPASAQQFNDIAFGNGLFVAVGKDASIQSSSEGKLWDSRQVIIGRTLNTVTYGGGQFIALGADGIISRSTDGKTWSTGYYGPTGTYNDITYANGMFMAVGHSGAIATSTNGIIWMVHPSVTSKQFEGITYGNGLWVGVGTDGLVGWSLTGTSWVVQSIADVYLTEITYSNGQFVAVGTNGKIVTSSTGLTWTVRPCKTSAHLWSIVPGNGLFVAVGEISSINDMYDATIITSPQTKTKSANALPSFPPSIASARLSAPEPGAGLQPKAYPNPVVNEFTVTLEGASEQEVRLWLVDATGRTVSDKRIQTGAGSYQEPMSLGQQEPGMYLLRVSTADQTKTIKVLKQ